MSLNNFNWQTVRARFLTVLVLTVVAFQGSVVGRQCPFIDPNDDQVDTAGLQCLLNGGGIVILDTPVDIYDGGYIIDDTLYADQPGTIVRSASSTQTARIKAADYLTNFMFWVRGTNIEIDHITFDGRKDFRSQPCNGTSANVLLWNDGAYMHDSESKNAYCGNAVYVIGNNMRIINNYVAYIGWDRYNNDGHYGWWGDGITVLDCGYHSEIAYNVVVDATDVGIVTGGGKCWVHHNQIWNGGQSAYAGLHVQNFPANGGGIYASEYGQAVFEYNTITAAVGDGWNRLGIGLLVGPHPWFPEVNVQYPIVRYNTVHDAAVNLLVEGAYSIALDNNDTSSPDPFGGHPGSNEQCELKFGVSYVVNPYHSSGAIPPGYYAAQLHNTEPPPNGPCFLF